MWMLFLRGGETMTAAVKRNWKATKVHGGLNALIANLLNTSIPTEQIVQLPTAMNISPCRPASP